MRQFRHFSHKQVTSFQNLEVKKAYRLKNKRQRDQTDTFFIEGFRELSRAVDGKFTIEKLFFSPEHFLKNQEIPLIQKIAKTQAELIECSKAVFEKLSLRDRPDGLIAIAKQRHLGIQDLDHLLKTKQIPFLLIAESIEKPGNLGTILRSCDAVQVDAAIICDQCTDIYNPNVIRSSIGTLFTQKVIECTTKDLLHYLAENKICILAATPKAKKEYTCVDLSEKIAIVVGSEQYGLSDAWMNQCDLQVKIPMLGVADSLNVSAATTLLLYEVIRQRSKA